MIGIIIEVNGDNYGRPCRFYEVQLYKYGSLGLVIFFLCNTVVTKEQKDTQKDRDEKFKTN